jgi:hypothetical protein
MTSNTNPGQSSPRENSIPNNLNVDIQQIFNATPAALMVLASDIPRFTILAVTDAYTKATLTRREEIVGKGVFEVFPDNPDDPNNRAVEFAKASFARVVENRCVDVMSIRKHDVRRPQSEGGGFEDRYWRPTNEPVSKLTLHGKIELILRRLVPCHYVPLTANKPGSYHLP